MIKLILASASKGRKHLLSLLKIPFEILPTESDEDKIVGNTPLETIQLRAKLKAEEALKKLSSDQAIQLSSYFDCLILTADTEVVFNNELIGKPKDFEDGKRILRLLSGKTHKVITAIYAIKVDIKVSKNIKKVSFARTPLVRLKVWEDYDRSFVTFRRLSEQEIKRYLSITDYTRCTGGYALLASPQDFVIRAEGSLSNIIGLPLEKVIPILKENNLLS